MGLNLNFTGTKASTGFTPLPENTYDVRIDSIEVNDTKEKDGVAQKTSDGKQAQYLNVAYKVTSGEYEGRLVWGIHSIRFPDNPLDDTEKEKQTREIFLGWLNTVTGTDFGDSNQELNLNNLVGSPCRAVVTIREYQGDPRNNIKRILPPEDKNSSLEETRRRL
jgi:hypothetical protein